jgi:hypothetical protein
MDDLGGNLAGEAVQMVRKRRSTRIVQAVPLQVAGVDALGRPFIERTSSLILNCHGCRYQSKHYVLKNMWVKLEIPHPETDQAPRTVRGRVAWIERPRTVRQLFQVALELEVPGNVWGIGFPPEDWFGFTEPENEAAAVAAVQGVSPFFPGTAPVDQGAHLQVHSATPEADFHVSLTEPDLLALFSPDNLRVFPSPASTTDASLQLARQVTRLLAEARQQIHAEAREAAAHAVSVERNSGREQWEQQIADAREALSVELAGAIEKIQDEIQTRTGAVHEAAAAALQDDLPKRLAPQLEELTRNLATRLSEEGAAQRTEQEQQLTRAAEALRQLCQQAEEAISRLSARAEEAEAQIGARAEAAERAIEQAARQREEFLGAQQESLLAAANEAEHRIASSFEPARENWQAHLNGEVEAAQARWQVAVDTAFASAEERAAGLLNERASTLVSEFQREAEQLGGALHQAATDAGMQCGRHIAGLQESTEAHTERLEGALTRSGEASERLENFTARLETIEQQALDGFQSHVDGVLGMHGNELHRRSESIFDEIAARSRGAFEESSQQALSQFSRQVEVLIEPQIASADEALQRLAGGRSLLDQTLTLHQERIRATTDQAFAEALAEFQGNLGSVEEVLRRSAEAVTANSLSALEARVESVKQQAVEDLVRSAEWYEKRAETQIQGVAERIGEQTGSQLSERAGKISTETSGEMDQSSRNVVTCAQKQMGDVVSDAFERARALFAEAAETTSAAFIDEIQRHARQDLEGYIAELQKSAVEARTRLDAARSDLAEKVTSEQEDFLRRFQTAMSDAVEAGVAEANQRVQSGFEPLLKSWTSLTETEMYEIYTRLGEQAAQQYRERLDNVSSQWMLATVTSLDHQSRDAVSKIAITTEEKLRETCTKVFADIGDAMRERLKQIAPEVDASAQERHSLNP